MDSYSNRFPTLLFIVLILVILIVAVSATFTEISEYQNITNSNEIANSFPISYPF